MPAPPGGAVQQLKIIGRLHLAFQALPVHRQELPPLRGGSLAGDTGLAGAGAVASAAGAGAGSPLAGAGAAGPFWTTLRRGARFATASFARPRAGVRGHERAVDDDDDQPAEEEGGSQLPPISESISRMFWRRTSILRRLWFMRTLISKNRVRFSSIHPDVSHRYSVPYSSKRASPVVTA